MLRFAFLTDNHVTHDARQHGAGGPGDPGDAGQTYRFTRRLIEHVLDPTSGKPVDLLIFGGDMLHQCLDSPLLVAQKWEAFHQALREGLGTRAIPFFFVFGNHELQTFSTDKWGGKSFFRNEIMRAGLNSLPQAFEVQFQDHYGLSADINTTYVVTYRAQALRFVILDNVVPRPLPGPLGSYNAALSLEQIGWLRIQLQSPTPTVVLSHVPLMPYGLPQDSTDGDTSFFHQPNASVLPKNSLVLWPKLAEGVDALLTDTDAVKGVFSGHLHQYRHIRVGLEGQHWLCGGHLRAFRGDLPGGGQSGFPLADVAYTIGEFEGGQLALFRCSYSLAPGQAWDAGIWSGPIPL